MCLCGKTFLYFFFFKAPEGAAAAAAAGNAEVGAQSEEHSARGVTHATPPPRYPGNFVQLIDSFLLMAGIKLMEQICKFSYSV